MGPPPATTPGVGVGGAGTDTLANGAFETDTLRFVDAPGKLTCGFPLNAQAAPVFVSDTEP